MEIVNAYAAVGTNRCTALCGTTHETVKRARAAADGPSVGKGWLSFEIDNLQRSDHYAILLFMRRLGRGPGPGRHAFCYKTF